MKTQTHFSLLAVVLFSIFSNGAFAAELKESLDGRMRACESLADVGTLAFRLTDAQISSSEIRVTLKTLRCSELSPKSYDWTPIALANPRNEVTPEGLAITLSTTEIALIAADQASQIISEVPISGQTGETQVTLSLANKPAGDRRVEIYLRTHNYSQLAGEGVVNEGVFGSGSYSLIF